MNYIKVKDVSFGYAEKKPLLDNLNLEFSRGEFTAIMGENGSGKTTLGKLLVGMLKPGSGSISIEGKDVFSMSLGQVGLKIGYLFQNPELQIFAATVIDELSFVMKLKDIDSEIIENKVSRVLELLSLKDKKESITYNLSYGEKQRLAIAGILINEPGYLILDEPTTGLDIIRKELLLSILKDLISKGVGIIVITHDLIFIKNFSGRLLKIREGKIIETGIK